MIAAVARAWRHLRAARRLALIVAVSGAIYTCCVLDLLLTRWAGRSQVASRWTRRWGRAVSSILGFRVRVDGELHRGPTLVTPNHLGYMDIVVLAAAFGVLFVSKAEVARWPLVGLLLKGTGHMTVDRNSRVAVRGAVEAVSRELKEGGTVCVFLEGTSSGGDSVKPFKPSLVQAAIDADAPLAPVAIRYRPFESGVVVAEEVAYWKDHVFGPHCWRLLGLRGALAEVTCGPVIHSRAADRKGLAELAHQRVSDLLKVAA